MCGSMQLNIYWVHYINIRVHSATVIRVVMLVNLEQFKEGQIITKNIQAKNKVHMPRSNHRNNYRISLVKFISPIKTSRQRT